MGDAHVHANLLADVTRADLADALERCLREASALQIELGGTVSGEHGDGRLRAPVLETVWGAEMVGLFRRVKEAFDPAGILNPGVKVPLPGQAPIGDVKYDPALPPLPAAARRALDHVADARAYARHRLDLLDAPPARTAGDSPVPTVGD